MFRRGLSRCAKFEAHQALVGKLHDDGDVKRKTLNNSKAQKRWPSVS